MSMPAVKHALPEGTILNTHSLYQCVECRTYWRLWRDSGGWSLADAEQNPWPCCDNSADFVSKLVPPLDPPWGELSKLSAENRRLREILTDTREKLLSALTPQTLRVLVRVIENALAPRPD